MELHPCPPPPPPSCKHVSPPSATPSLPPQLHPRGCTDGRLSFYLVLKPAGADVLDEQCAPIGIPAWMPMGGEGEEQQGQAAQLPRYYFACTSTSSLPSTYVHAATSAACDASVMHRTCISHAPHLHQSCTAPASVMHRTCISHAPHLHQSCTAPASVMHHTCISRATHLH